VDTIYTRYWKQNFPGLLTSYNPALDPSMPECAFCPNTANISAEHLWSDWMDDLFPGKKLFTKRDKEGNVLRQWVSHSLNWKAKVVCKTCNETWMSDIESKHAKPSMTDLIRLRWPLVIDEKRANSLAIFAFKTAVVFDHVARNRPPFFRDPLGVSFVGISPFRRWFACGWLPPLV
jgi:hypothetical protein